MGFAVVQIKECFNEAAGIPRGRPISGKVYYMSVTASMRPRVFPAEDERRLKAEIAAIEASMRPRVFPAEDRCCG